MLRVLVLILFLQYFDLDCSKAKVFIACSFGIAEAANWLMALVVVLPVRKFYGWIQKDQ